jgi:hypothetical protein
LKHSTQNVRRKYYNECTNAKLKEDLRTAARNAIISYCFFLEIQNRSNGYIKDLIKFFNHSYRTDNMAESAA